MKKRKKKGSTKEKSTTGDGEKKKKKKKVGIKLMEYQRRRKRVGERRGSNHGRLVARPLMASTRRGRHGVRPGT